MKKYHEKGSVSVFMAVVMSSILIFALILTDCARMAAFRTVYSEKIDFAANSLLADFCDRLRDRYALYGCYVTSESTGKNQLYSYMNTDASLLRKSIQTAANEDYRALTLFDCDIKKADVTYGDSLRSVDILKKQINEYMKYKTPANIAEKLSEMLSEKLTSLNNASEEAKKQKAYQECENQRTEIEYKIRELESAADISDKASDSVKAVFRAQTDLLKAALLLPEEETFSQNAVEELLSEMRLSLSAYTESCNGILAKISDITEAVEKLSKKYKEQNSEHGDIALFISKADYGDERISVSQNISEADKAMLAINEFDRTDEKTELLSDFPDKIKPVKIHSVLQSGGDIPAPKSISFDVNSVFEKLKQKSGDIIIPSGVYNSLLSQNYKAENPLSDVFDNLSLFSFADIASAGDKSLNTVDIAKHIVSGSIDGLLVNDYISSYFSCLSESNGEPSYFTAEAEYIICGNQSQRENVNSCLSGIYAIRCIMNYAHILSDAEKKDATEALGNAVAAAVSEGIGGPVYAGILNIIWACAESAVDISSLKSGKAVPFYKEKSDWKTSLENALSGEDAKDDSQKGKGMTYKDYLSVLMLFVPSDTKIARICDLIELNMRKEISSTFTLARVYSSVTASCELQFRPIVSADKSLFGKDSIYAQNYSVEKKY